MREEIISVIAPFIKLNPGQVNEQTPIGRRAVASSITLHRMYAKLAGAGFVVNDYWGIQTVGDLLKRFSVESPEKAEVLEKNDGMPRGVGGPRPDAEYSIGIDAQPIADFEEVADFRQDEFYRMNFSPTEIAWCQLQRNPLTSFAGLFAAKEAMIKADNRLINTPFSQLSIGHLPSGKPVTQGFRLSITHTDDMAIAVAIPHEQVNDPLRNNTTPIITNPKGRFLELALILLAFGLSLFAFLWSIFH